ncbi:hypothetical protein V8C43DRAFT_290238 [Trichoderma afarasin]
MLRRRILYACATGMLSQLFTPAGFKLTIVHVDLLELTGCFVLYLHLCETGAAQMEHVHAYTFLLIFVVSSKGMLSFFSSVRLLSTDRRR